MNEKIQNSEIVTQIKNYYDLIEYAISIIPGDFKLNFKKDLANYYMNLLYLFNVLNEDNLQFIESIQNDKLYDLSMIQSSGEFENNVPYFVSGAIEFCELYGNQLIDAFNQTYDIIIKFYEASGSILLMNSISSDDINSLLSFYNHIRNAENEWNDFIEEYGYERREPIKFTLTANGQSLDEFIEYYLDLTDDYNI